MGKRSGNVGFFVTNNIGEMTDMTDNGGTTGTGTSGRRGGLNLGEIPNNDVEDLHNVTDEGDVAEAEEEDGQRSFGSNNNNLGSDLEDDL